MLGPVMPASCGLVERKMLRAEAGQVGGVGSAEAMWAMGHMVLAKFVLSLWEGTWGRGLAGGEFSVGECGHGLGY